MSYLASHIATVPSAQIEWYLIFHETSFSEDLKKEIDTSGEETYRRSAGMTRQHSGSQSGVASALRLYPCTSPTAVCGVDAGCEAVAEWLMVFSLAEIDNELRSLAIASF